METKGILVDTSIIIDFYRKKYKSKTPLFKLFNKNRKLYISVFTTFELLCSKSSSLESDIQKLLPYFEILDFTEKESIISAQQYKTLKIQNRIIDMIDLFIAATAQSYSLSIATLNIDHFERIENISLESL